ncbi:unnamed protein product, partial [Sphacelaria rigidula]
RHGVGFAVKKSIMSKATWTQALISERLMSMTFNLAGKSNAATSVVVYAHTDNPQSREERDVFWTELDGIVNPIPPKHHLFISMNANARTIARTGEKKRKIVGALGRDSRSSDSNCTSLMQFAGDNRLSLVNKFFPTPEENTSRTFNAVANRPADRKRIDYIIAR